MKIRNLNEAFSSTMPDWFKQLVFVNKWQNGKYPRQADGNFVSLNADRRDIGRGDMDKVAGRLINNKEGTPGLLDFANAEFFVDDVPKLDDPILSDPNKMCFIYLESDLDRAVWVPGRSPDSERFTFTSDDGKERTIALKFLNNKLLKKFGKGFCYVDLTNPNNFMSDKQIERTNAKFGTVNRYVTPKQINDFKRYTWGGKLDKSGYQIIPSTDRYKDKLRYMKIKNAPEKLEKLRSRLVKAQRDINEMKNYIFNLERVSKQDLDAFTDAQAYEVHALKMIREIMDLIDNSDTTYSWSKDRFINDLNKLLNVGNRALDNLEAAVNPYVLSSLDDEGEDLYTDIDIADFE